MRYFVIGNSHVPRNMTPEQAWISLRIDHNDIQIAFLNYEDAVKVARAHQAKSNELCPIIQIDVSKTAEEPISSRFYIDGKEVKDKSRAVYLTTHLRGTDKDIEYKVLDATFDYNDKYAPTSIFNYSELDYCKIAAEIERIRREQFAESIARSEAQLKAARQKAIEDEAKQKELVEKQKADEQVAKQKADEQAAKQIADELAAKQKADESVAKEKAKEQIAKGQADIVKKERKEQKAQRRGNANLVAIAAAHNQEVAAQTKKFKSYIYYGATALICAGTMLYLSSSATNLAASAVATPLIAQIALLVTGSIFAIYVGKKAWKDVKELYKEYKYSDRMRYHLKKENLLTQVDTLRHEQGYDLIQSKFGKELDNMLAKFKDPQFEANGSYSSNQPVVHTSQDVLSWQKQALEQVAAVTGSRKVIKQQLLEHAKQKFTL